MTITELRSGEENGYKVEFVESFPKDKIIIALCDYSATAFLVTKADDYKESKGLNLLPIAHLEKTNRSEYTTEKELLNDSGFKILALNTLEDIGKIEQAWAYS
jgi:hypothetical protein